MNPLPPVLPGTFKDRSTSLIIFGILTLIIGVLCAGFVPLMLMATSVPAQPGAPAQSWQTLVPGLAFYAIMAVTCIWLGIGSIMKRRWARALLLIGAWSWLATGVLALVFMALLLPEMQKSMAASMKGVSSATVWVTLAVVMGFITFIYLVLPGIWLLFYRGRNVKATCEHYDPIVRWTDRCPLPVLAVVIWMAFSVFASLVMTTFPMILPFFGIVLSGTAARVAFALMAIVWGYAGWQLYRLKLAGWWVIVAAVTLFTISALITYSRYNIMELYRLMNLPAEQLVVLEKYNFLQGGFLYLSVLLWVVPFGAYLYYIRRFFPATVRSSDS